MDCSSTNLLQMVPQPGWVSPELKSTETLTISSTGQSNVSFVQMLFPENRSDPKLFDIIANKVLRKVDREVDLYVRYGTKYTISEVIRSTGSQYLLFKSKRKTSFPTYYF